MMQLKDLCLALVHCESEEELIGILKSERYCDNSDNWHFYGADGNQPNG